MAHPHPKPEHCTFRILKLHLRLIFFPIFSQPLNVTPAVRPSVTVQPIPPRRMRVKKGAKRLKKIVNKPKTKEQLDNEMEDYRAAAPIF